MVGIAASVLLLLTTAPEWDPAPLDQVVIEPHAFVCLRKTDDENGASFYLILEHDEKRRLVDISLIQGDAAETALLRNRLRSFSTRGDDLKGAIRVTAGGVGSGHRVELELITQWEGTERSTEIAVTWDGRQYRTPCSPIAVPSKYR